MSRCITVYRLSCIGMNRGYTGTVRMGLKDSNFHSKYMYRQCTTVGSRRLVGRKSNQLSSFLTDRPKCQPLKCPVLPQWPCIHTTKVVSLCLWKVNIIIWKGRYNVNVNYVTKSGRNTVAVTITLDIPFILFAEPCDQPSKECFRIYIQLG